MAIDERVSGEEVLGLFGRLEPLHLALSPPRRPMGVFSPIIQITALPVFHTRKQLALSDAIAAQLVGHDHPRHILQALQKSPEEALGSVGIAPGLNKDIEHDAVLIDGAPEIVLYTLDPDEDFVHVPLVPRPWPAASHAVGEMRAEFLAPASHRLVGDDYAALSQEQPNIPQAQAEHMIQPDSVADDLGGEPMAVGWVGCRLHATSLARLRAGYQKQFP